MTSPSDMALKNKCLYIGVQSDHNPPLPTNKVKKNEVFVYLGNKVQTREKKLPRTFLSHPR